MGFLNGLMGNASETDVKELEKELSNVIGSNETIELAYKLVRDLIVFTDLRLIFVDKQGLTGKKVEYLSVPYKSISRFSIETAGHFDLDAELNIWISGAELPAISKQFKKDNSIYDVQKALASYVAKA
ncbi:PH domain-containing protein [Niallia circulans]|uniref:PH domain-containing protein n=1 Tax=Niallia circulans TaxID=1397 RepID=UPI0026EDB2F7|nr:PH domain-containing protein [Niallia circulans]